jgi:hypothetical protein
VPFLNFWEKSKVLPVQKMFVNGENRLPPPTGGKNDQ